MIATKITSKCEFSSFHELLIDIHLKHWAPLQQITNCITSLTNRGNKYIFYIFFFRVSWKSNHLHCPPLQAYYFSKTQKCHTLQNVLVTFNFCKTHYKSLLLFTCVRGALIFMESFEHVIGRVQWFTDF